MKKEFYTTLLRLATPIAFQNLIISSINLADVFMIGRLGEVSLASVGLANQIYFLLMLLLFGICSGASVFTAQFWGDKNIRSIHKTLGLGLSISLVAAGFFTIMAQIMPENLIRVYSPDLEVIKEGGSYLKIVSLSYIATAISISYVFQMRSVEKPKVGVLASILALLINISLNYVLIFGKFGAPAMGVRGAALATLIARTLECAFIISYVYLTDNPIKSSIKDMFSFDKKFARTFRITTTPVILNELFWSLGITSYSMVYGRMGTSATAVVNIIGSIDRIAFTGLIGVANAAAIMIGKKIGEKDENAAIIYANKLAKISIGIGVVTSITLFILAKPILGYYNLSPEAYRLSLYTMYALCIIAPIKSLNATVVVGILRAGGDTKYCLILDVAAMWIIGIPLVAFGGLKLGLPVFLVYSLAFSEEAVKFFLGIRRVMSKKWVNNLITE